MDLIFASVSRPDAANAALLGANTVKGPTPESTSTRPACKSAVFNNEKSLLVETIVAIELLDKSSSLSFLQETKRTETAKAIAKAVRAERLKLMLFILISFILY